MTVSITEFFNALECHVDSAAETAM